MTQIYEIISLIHPETVYVGKHKGDIFKDNYWGSGIVITNYIKKYGKENFERRICNTISNEKVIWEEFERFWIAYYKESGWNVLNRTIGGDGGSVQIWSKERKDKQSKWMIENNPFRGKHHKEELKKWFSESQIGKVVPRERVFKQQESRKGYIPSKETREKTSKTLQKHDVSLESKRKNSESHKGKPAWNRGISPNKETIEKIRQAALNQSDETRKKRSDSLKNKPWSPIRRLAYKTNKKKKENI